MEVYFQQVEQGRVDFYRFTEQLNHPWKRPLPDKWSAAETIYHLILMVRFVRRFSAFYVPVMLPYAYLRKSQRYKTEIHNIYEEYKHSKKKPMKAPFVLTPPKNLEQKYQFTQLQEILHNETSKLREMLSSMDEAVAGQIRYPDPIAHYPNIIQSIHLLAINEEHHFKLTEKYEIESLKIGGING